ncbi:phosphoglycolate phosphatase [Selenomonas sp. WCT3]|uniref:HAD family hydrolase n=1 Tax=Selenomonas sp. WCT3 TaxID=3158785 RepID=UPI000885F090|nr:phosphoglycolate phosphatase [Selenomonas ruminantium]
MKYKAAIFDLDGTLIDSLADLGDSANEMLASYGFPAHTIEEYRYFVGNGSRKLIERCLPKDKAQDASFVDEALARYKACYEKNLVHKTKCYAGIDEMLQALQEKNIPLGICTNKHQSAADEVCQKLLAKHSFVEIIGDRPGLPRKPDPQKVLAIAAKMGVKPEEVAYFGDTSVDMETARNAGFLPVGVTWGFRPRQELVETGAEVLLDNPMELFEQLEF